MKNPAKVITMIEETIELLSHPLSEADKAAGWTEGIRQNWHRGLKSLEDDIRQNPQGDFARNNLARNLGMDAIDHGPLAERIAHIGSLLMNLVGSI
jgi:hypothetical protein